jgi:hypothetical protein
MKDLTQLTNEGLIGSSEELYEQFNQEQAMDVSGDCGHLINKAFEPLFKALNSELESRGMLVLDESTELEMPY